MISKEAIRLANVLRDNPRGPHDVDAAMMLRVLADVYEVAHEMIHAQTEESCKATYAHLYDLLKGKRID